MSGTSNVIRLDDAKRKELFEKRRTRAVNQLCLDLITGVASVMIRGNDIDIRFRTAENIGRRWWSTVEVVVTHMQTGKRFEVMGSQETRVYNEFRNEASVTFWPCLTEDYLGPDEGFRVEIITDTGERAHWIAERPEGFVRNESESKASRSSPPPPLPGQATRKVIPFRRIRKVIQLWRKR